MLAKESSVSSAIDMAWMRLTGGSPAPLGRGGCGGGSADVALDRASDVLSAQNQPMAVFKSRN